MSLTSTNPVMILWSVLEAESFAAQNDFFDMAHWYALASYCYTPVTTLIATNFNVIPVSLIFLSWVGQSLLLFVVFGGVIFYSLSFGVKLLKTTTTNFDAYMTSFAYFADLEEEMGAADDGLYFFLVFALVIVWFFFFTLWGGFLTTSISWIITLFAVVGLTAVVIPTFVLKNFGLAFVNYVRGGGRTSSLMFETMLDFVAVAVIMIRFMIQNIRFVFIFSAFFELYEYIYDKLNFDFLYTSQVAANANFLVGGEHSAWYWYDLVGHYALQWVLYLYYLGHLTLLFIAQLSIYFALSFWLFFFLYTTFTLETQEKYFLVQRAEYVTK